MPGPEQGFGVWSRDEGARHEVLGGERQRRRRGDVLLDLARVRRPRHHADLGCGRTAASETELSKRDQQKSARRSAAERCGAKQHCEASPARHPAREGPLQHDRDRRAAQPRRDCRDLIQGRRTDPLKWLPSIGIIRNGAGSGGVAAAPSRAATFGLPSIRTEFPEP
jgi:hypothetical protein